MYLLILFKAVILLASYFSDSQMMQYVKKFAAMAKFENMVIGGIGALIIKNKIQYLLDFIKNPIVLLFSISFIFISIYIFPDYVLDGIHLINSFLFLIIIINVSTNPNSFLKLENRTYKFLGKISYGIYMYHLIVIFIAIKSMIYFGYTNFSSLKANVVLYVFSIGITIVISHFSYNYFEGYFLKMKVKYTSVKSGD